MSYKTWKHKKSVQDTVTSAEQSAGQKVIYIGTGMPSVATTSFVYNINITRSDIDKTNNAKHYYSTVSGAVFVETNSTDYVLTTGDIVTISGTYL